MPWKIQFLILYNECVSLLNKGRRSTIFTKGRHFFCVSRLHFDCRLPAAYSAFHSLKRLLMESRGRLSEMAAWIKGFSFNVQMTHWSSRNKQMSNQCPFVGGWRWDRQLANQKLTFGWIKPTCRRTASLHNRYCFFDLKCLGKNLLSFESSVCENPQPSVGWKHSSTKKQCSDTNWEEVLASRYLIKTLREKAFMSTFTSAFL